MKSILFLYLYTSSETLSLTGPVITGSFEKRPPDLRVLVLTKRHVGSGNEIGRQHTEFAQAQCYLM